MVIDRIVRETSLSAGDVSNAMISLGAIVRDALLMGASVDLAELGSFRVIAPPTMMDKEIDVTAETLKTPKIVFTPKSQMRDAAKSVELSVDNPERRKKKGGSRSRAARWCFRRYRHHPGKVSGIAPVGAAGPCIGRGLSFSGERQPSCIISLLAEDCVYFTLSTMALKASGLLTARSASTLRLISIPALCSAPISWL